MSSYVERLCARFAGARTSKSGKRYLIFDPTWEETPFGQVENNLQGSYGLLVEGTQSQLIRIPVMDPALNTVQRTASLQLNPDGSLKGTVIDKRFGDIADRRRREYMSADAKKQGEFLTRVAGQDLMAVSVSDIRVENLDALNKELTKQYALQATRFASFTGPLLMLRPRVLGSYALDVDRKPRKVPIDLFETMQGNDEYDIQLPEGYVVDELPDPVSQDFGFASCRSSAVLHGNTLHYSRTYTLREVTLPAVRYAVRIFFLTGEHHGRSPPDSPAVRSSTTFENTDFTREHSRKEEGKVENVTDVYKRGRGTPTQLTDLFVAMARSAGMHAYVMDVPDRSIEYFTPRWLSFRQFDGLIAIVTVDGKERFFDPGSRFCSFDHLAWEHTFVSGLRQTDDGTAVAQTPGDGYAANRITRVANLDMDEHGEVTGKIDLKFFGSDALHWRHIALRADEESLKDRLRTMLEERVPRSLEVKVATISGKDEYEQPLSVSFEVKGTLGTATGKRLVLPVDLFESGSTSAFASDKRETAVDFQYARSSQDALRVNFKRGFEMEAAPKAEKFDISSKAAYNIAVESTPTSVSTRRTYAMGDFLFMPKDYPTLQKFYAQVQAKDKESVVLKTVPTAATSSSGN